VGLRTTYGPGKSESASFFRNLPLMKAPMQEPLWAWSLSGESAIRGPKVQPTLVWSSQSGKPLGPFGNGRGQEDHVRGFGLWTLFPERPLPPYRSSPSLGFEETLEPMTTDDQLGRLDDLSRRGWSSRRSGRLDFQEVEIKALTASNTSRFLTLGPHSQPGHSEGSSRSIFTRWTSNQYLLGWEIGLPPTRYYITY